MNGNRAEHSFYDGFGNYLDQVALGEQVLLGGNEDDEEGTSPSFPEQQDEALPATPAPEEEEEMGEEPQESELDAENRVQREILESARNTLLHGKNLLLECPTGCKRRITILKAMLNYWHWLKSGMEVEGLDDSNRHTAPVPSKIYVATRNFRESQMVLNEIKKELETASTLIANVLRNIKLSLLDHHKNLCLNETNPPNAKKFREDYSRRSSCRFSESYMQSDPLPFVTECGHSVHDIQEIMNYCQASGRCAHVDVCRLARDADLIICPMEFLLSPVFRLEYDIKLDKAVILMDDSYNLEDLCRKEATVTMTLSDANNARAFVDSLTRDFQIREEEDIGLGTLNEFLTAFYTWFRDKTETRKFLDQEIILDFLKCTLNVNAMNIEKILKCLVQSAGNYLPDCDSESIDKVPKFISCLHLLLTKMNKGNFFVELNTAGAQSNPNLPEIVFRIICADPSVILKPVEQAANSLIVASNCLAPYPPFQTEFEEFSISLGNPVKVLPHSSYLNQLLVLYTDEGPNGQKFTLGMNDRKKPNVMRETGCALLELCKVIPKGKIATFHSYEYIQRTWKYWNTAEIEPGKGTILQAIQNVTNVFSEMGVKTERAAQELVANFQAAAKTEKGAVLLLLTRGKIYESWDLNYPPVWGIIHISIPFGPIWKPNIVAKKVYLGKRYEDDNSVEILEHYHKEAFRRLNRSFCCSIQDIAKDRGVVIVLDTRMEGESGDFEDTMPSWIQTPVKCDNFSSLLEQMVDKVKQFPDCDK